MTKMSEFRVPFWNKLVAMAGFLVLLLLPTGLFAQSTGTVIGTVTDQSGAVVPKAKVTLVDQATKGSRDTVSNDVGYFSFGTVNPGTYNIKVTASGFKSWQQNGLAVRPGDVRNVADIALQIGRQEETVSVEAVAGEIAPVDSGEKSSTLTSKQIDNLTLEGRDATELVRTLPGFSAFNGGNIGNQAQDFTVVSPTGGAVGQGYSANGNPYRGGTDLTADGAHIIDAGCNCGATQTVNGDMVSEVKVQTSNFGADSAKGPVVVSAVSKSGSTEYHGEVYLHARDSSMNSLDSNFKKQVLADQTHLLTPFSDRYLYPGGSFGGPIPHTNKKAIFWVGYEYYKQSNFADPRTTSGLLEAIIPTASMRAGNFNYTGAGAPADNAALCALHGGDNFCQGATGFNPDGTVIANNTLNAIDPGAAAMLKAIPMPNANPTTSGGFNYVEKIPLNQNGWMLHPRVDYNFTDNTKLYVTYNEQRENDQEPIHLWWTPSNSVPFPGGMSSNDVSRTIAGHFLHVFSPSLTNEVIATYAYINYPLVPNNPSSYSNQSNGYPYAPGPYATKSPYMPSISNGYWVNGVPQIDQGDIFSQSGGSFTWRKWTPTIEDNLTKSFKSHTIKAGFYWERTANDQGEFSHINGEMSYAPAFGAGGLNQGAYVCGISSAICNALPQNCTTDGNAGSPARNCFGSDNPVANLLLGAGSYFENSQYALDNMSFNTYSGYVMDNWKATKRLTLDLGLRIDHLGTWHPDDSPAGFAAWIPSLYASDVAAGTALPGVRWNGIDKSISPAGFQTRFAYFEPRIGLAYDIFGTGKTVLRGGWGMYGYRDQFNDVQTSLATANGVQTWNSPGGVSLSQLNAYAAAVGSGAAPAPPTTANTVDPTEDRQPITYSYNFTISQQVAFRSLLEVSYVGNHTSNMPLEGNSNNASQDLLNVNVIPTGTLFKDYAPGTNISGLNLNMGNYSPFPAYAHNNINVVRQLGVSDYNSLQISWVKQAGRITYNFNYVWSKVLGTLGTPQLGGAAGDPTNIKNDYGIASIDRSHVFNFSYTLDTGDPIKGNKVLATMINRWQLSGITTWQSGGDIPSLYASGFNAGGTGVGGLPINATNYLGTPDGTVQPTLLCDPTSHLQKGQYVNGACFGLAAPGTNGPYNYPYIHGPAFFNSDLALFKTFRLTEHQSIQFRASAYNFLNHPLNSFDPNNGSPLNIHFTNGVVDNATAGPGVQNPFGYTPIKLGRRVVELSAKYTF